MEPYTADGMARQEAEGSQQRETTVEIGAGDAFPLLSPTLPNGDGSGSDSGFSTTSSVNGAGEGDKVNTIHRLLFHYFKQ